ncbi:MAG TPA: S-layer homology domain-containing protein [Candidatus Limnocylindria bacterium]|nr:S-layer homology domain-containing protein [Candidatus Limnocylindria bacterium]
MPAPRRRPIAVVALLLALAAFPLASLASHDFTDVPDSNIYHADISALADTGVTTGCGGGNFCPSAFVTREQMAAFMNRLGALAPEKTPVVNADRLDGYHANALARSAYNSTEGLELGALASATLSTTITTPALGYLLIWGRSSLYFVGTGGDYVACQLEVDNSDVPGTFTWQGLTDDFGTDDGCNLYGRSTVCAADTYTVDLEIADLSLDTQASDAAIMVEYVPFDSAGDTAAADCAP